MQFLPCILYYILYGVNNINKEGKNKTIENCYKYYKILNKGILLTWWILAVN